MDHLLAINGLLGFLTAMVIVTSQKRLRVAAPWIWLSLFGCFHGAHRLALLLSCSYPDDYNLRLATLWTAVLAVVALMEFARTGSHLSGRPRLTQWVVVPFALLAALGSTRGEAFFFRSLMATMGMPAAFWSAWAFWRAGRAGGDLDRRVSIGAAGALAVLGVLMGLQALAPSLSLFIADAPVHRLDPAISAALAVEMAALATLAIALWLHASSARLSPGAGGEVSRFQQATVAGLLLAMALGGVATELTGRLADRQQRALLLDKTQTVAASLDGRDIRELVARGPSKTDPAYLRLRQQCLGLVNVSERPCYIYLLGKQGTNILFYLDTEPVKATGIRTPSDRPTAEPGEVYDDAPAGLKAVFVSGRSITVGPYKDKWGTYVSGFASVREPGGGGSACVVGFDIDASDWNSAIAQTRLLPIVITLLLAGMLSMFIIVRERDVTARIRLLGAVRDKQAILDAASEVAVIATDPQGLITLFNRGAEKMLGYAAAEVAGKESFLMLHVEGELAERGRSLSQARSREVKGFDVLVEVARQEGAEQREWTLQRKDGTRVPVSLAVTTTRGSAGEVTGFLGVAVDMTARKNAERELSEKERFISTVAQASPDFLVVYDLVSARPLYANRRPFGLPAPPASYAEQAGHSSLKELLHPEDLPRLREHMERIRLAADGEVKTIEFRIRAPAGDYRWFQSRDTVFRRDENGRVVQFLSVTQDITEIRQAETSKKRLESQLRQSQKLEAVGQLAAGVAHDFNNLLTVIHGNASLLQESARDESLLYCKQVIQAAQRAAELTRQLLVFSRQHAPQRQLLNLGDVIPRLSELLGRLIGEHIHLQWRCDAGLPPIFADPSMIEQVILNLAVNSRDAMPSGGSLTLSVEAVMLDASAANRHPRARPGRFLCLSVADTGTGIDAETLPRIFEPFFTTKEVGKGTGLGLATVYGIVEQHQGWIEVWSQVEKGTVFRVFLPVSLTGAEPAPALPSPPVRRGKGETILLVEDEASVREFAERVLRRAGYQVLAAANGVEAVELWPRHRDQIDLLLSDQLMPEGMMGHELAAQLRGQRPCLKVILTSGYCADARDIQGNHDAVEFIAKPYTPAQLLLAVQKILAGNDASKAH